ncbi:MAG: DUF378 domain-containing protein [Brumimicrobium sp.]|nr:DUF378 domain-containing protein [Brumimicrobium sp.]
MKNLSKITLVLTVIGAVFYLLFSMAGIDVISKITGGDRTIGGDFIRIIIGLSAIFSLISSFTAKK